MRFTIIKNQRKQPVTIESFRRLAYFDHVFMLNAFM